MVPGGAGVSRGPRSSARCGRVTDRRMQVATTTAVQLTDAPSARDARRRGPVGVLARRADPTSTSSTGTADHLGDDARLAAQHEHRGRAGGWRSTDAPEPSRRERVDAEEQRRARGHQRRQQRDRRPREAGDAAAATGRTAEHEQPAAQRRGAPHRGAVDREQRRRVVAHPGAPRRTGRDERAVDADGRRDGAAPRTPRRTGRERTRAPRRRRAPATNEQAAGVLEPCRAAAARRAPDRVGAPSSSAGARGR